MSMGSGVGSIKNFALIEQSFKNVRKEPNDENLFSQSAVDTIEAIITAQVATTQATTSSGPATTTRACNISKRQIGSNCFNTQLSTSTDHTFGLAASSTSSLSASALKAAVVAPHDGDGTDGSACFIPLECETRNLKCILNTNTTIAKDIEAYPSLVCGKANANILNALENTTFADFVAADSVVSQLPNTIVNMLSPAVVNMPIKLLERSASDCIDIQKQQHKRQQLDIDISEHVQQQQLTPVFADDPRALQLALELSMATLSERNSNGGGGGGAGLRTTTASPTDMQYFCNYEKPLSVLPRQNCSIKSTYINNQQTHLEYQQTHLEQQQHQLQKQQQHNRHDETASQNTKLNAAIGAAGSGSVPPMLSSFDLSLLPTPLLCSRNNNMGATVGFGGSGRSEQHPLLTDNLRLNTPLLMSAVDIAAKPLLTNTGGILTTIDERSKKSQNMTECVPVPSSEHVAEIVGRQGCKIKALRAKTNTYIKTPVRGDEPVFIITGRKEDVAKAQREILSAADHFSLIRATRRPSYDSTSSLTGIENNTNLNGCTNGDTDSVSSAVGFNSTSIPTGPPSKAGQITIQVRVPYRVVGLVVGTKGATIKHIQQETQTYIVTPSREKEPIFEVTGLPDNVQIARKKIEAHIALRTGNVDSAFNNDGVGGCGVGDGDGSGMGGGGTVGGAFDKVLTAATANVTDASGITAVHSINTLSQFLNQTINLDFLTSIYKDSIVSSYMTSSNDVYSNNSNSNHLNSNTAAAVAAATVAAAHNDRLLLSNAISNMKSDLNNAKYANQNKMRPPAIASASEIDTTFHMKQPAVGQTETKITMETNNMHFDEIQTQHQQQQHQQDDITNFQRTINVEQQQQKFNGETALSFQTVDTCANSALATTATTTANNTNTEIIGNDRTKISDNNLLTNHYNRTTANMNIFRSEVVNRMVSANGFTRSCSSASSTSSTKSVNNGGDGSVGSSRPELINIWRNISDSLEVDEGISESPNIWNLQTNQAPLLAATFTGSHCSPVTSISPTDSLLNEINANNINLNAGDSVQQQQQQQQQQQKHLLTQQKSRRFCLACSEKEVTATGFLPCGHNSFCLDCSNRIFTNSRIDGNDINITCPICNLRVYQTMQIST